MRAGVHNPPQGTIGKARLAAEIFIAWWRRRHRATDFRGQLPTSLDTVGDELTGRLPDRADHARALPPIPGGLHGSIDDRLRRREAGIGVVLFGSILEKLGRETLLAWSMAGREDGPFQ